ncbi:MAG: hypothetical protein JO180_12530 [Gemmatirosa sp.]|nr:hypothetical protein [Gemmatirosa sp.]
MDPAHRHLAWFLGPKAENASVMEDLVLLILRDYAHWRKNYFPSDPILVTKTVQRSHLTEHDTLNQYVHQLLADLRRNFPFYSPRYIGHELSDTLVPATLGYIAGLMFNPNNVTPEAAPVTTHLEIEACNAVLRMLGYATPPDLPATDADPGEYYLTRAATEFGWAHITSGGTVANIEALWVARQVRYLPLAVQEVAQSRRLSLEVKLADGTPHPIQDIAKRDLLFLRPNEATYLLSRYVHAVRDAEQMHGALPAAVNRRAWSLLNESRYALSRGVAAAFAEFPPVVLVAGTAHYSIRKAADIIGVGKDNVVLVRSDEFFRMDVEDLERRIEQTVDQGRIPLCVVANIGTTEEGAVDPLHEIVNLRARLERDRRQSFWIHADAAWGGFIRSVFVTEPDADVRGLTKKISRVLGFPHPGDLADWHTAFVSFVEATYLTDAVETSDVTGRDAAGRDAGVDTDSPDDGPHDAHEPSPARSESGRSAKRFGFEKRVQEHLAEMARLLHSGDFTRYARHLEAFPRQLKRHGESPVATNAFQWTFDDIHHTLTEYVSDTVHFTVGRYERSLPVSWPSRDVCAAFLRFPKADSITIDPHKMGYLPYPCGCVAFRNDRVRHFVMQQAPYITAANHSAMVHLPPRHVRVDTDGDRRTQVDGFGPFILEGSKPGAAAASLWLSTKTVPLTMEGHGSIVRASLLAARALHEWLVQWGPIHNKIQAGLEYEFVPLTGRAPDTNLVTFVVKKRVSTSLVSMNKLTESVYRHFAIQAELGEMEYSYAQPFFISRTTMNEDTYSVSELEPFLQRCHLSDQSRREYAQHGISVLRASVMNPYIQSMHHLAGQDIVRMFVEELARAAASHVRDV